MEESERTALLAVAMNLGIFGIKYVSALVSGSLALKAEAFHSFADLIASLTVLTGLKIAKRKSKLFPYGLYKIENLLAVCISLVIFYTGFEIVSEVMNATPTELRKSEIAIFSLLAAIIITLWFSKYEKKIGQKINSPILLADSAHIRADVLSNSIVLLAIVSNLFGYHFDKIAALVVVIFITKTGFKILTDGVRVLLDASIDHQTLSKVEKIILQTPQVVELKALKGRNSGRYKFIEADIILKIHNFDRAHYIADKIERSIKDEIRNIDQVLIHYEPLQKEVIVYALPLTDDLNAINSHFGESACFMLVTFRTGEKVAGKVEIIKNPYSKTEKGKGILSAEFLTQKMIDFVLLKKDFSSKGPSYVFSNANIEVITTNEETPKQAFEKLGLIFNPTSDQIPN
jgi:cation diffusion facilitator family transporter